MCQQFILVYISVVVFNCIPELSLCIPSLWESCKSCPERILWEGEGSSRKSEWRALPGKRSRVVVAAGLKYVSLVLRIKTGEVPQDGDLQRVREMCHKQEVILHVGKAQGA